MITAIVEFNLPSPFTLDQARQTFRSTAPKYRGMPGLIRKDYFVSEDGMKAGGIYLWASREAADAIYTEDWKAFVRGKYGTDPTCISSSPISKKNRAIATAARAFGSFPPCAHSTAKPVDYTAVY